MSQSSSTSQGIRPKSSNPASLFHFQTAAAIEWLARSSVPLRTTKGFKLWSRPKLPFGAIESNLNSVNDGSKHNKALKCYALTILNVLADTNEFAAEKSMLELGLDCQVDGFSDALWCNTAKSRPDICLKYNGAALVCFEVASENKQLDAVCAQLFVVVAEQFRVLREADFPVSSCVGYALPQQDNQIPFTKVTASWSKETMQIQFGYEIIAMTFDNFKHTFETTLKQCIRDQISPQLALWRDSHKQPLPATSICKLSTAELEWLRSKLSGAEDKTLVQLPSRDSLVFKTSDETLFWKLSDAHKNKMRDLKNEDELNDIIVKFDAEAKFDGRTMLRYPGHDQLTLEHLRETPTLFWNIVDTLQRFHRAGYAHLDVRIQNMVLNKQNPQQVLLIDLDRSLTRSKKVGAMRDDYARSIWCGCSNNPDQDEIFVNWDVERLDWLQLALTLLDIPTNSKKLVEITKVKRKVNKVKHEQTRVMLQELLEGREPNRVGELNFFALFPASGKNTKHSTPIKSKIPPATSQNTNDTTTNAAPTPKQPSAPDCFKTPTNSRAVSRVAESDSNNDSLEDFSQRLTALQVHEPTTSTPNNDDDDNDDDGDNNDDDGDDNDDDGDDNDETVTTTMMTVTTTTKNDPDYIDRSTDDSQDS